MRPRFNFELRSGSPSWTRTTIGRVTTGRLTVRRTRNSGPTRNRTEAYALQAHRASRYHYEPVRKPPEGIEPSAFWFVAKRSCSDELRGHKPRVCDCRRGRPQRACPRQPLIVGRGSRSRTAFFCSSGRRLNRVSLASIWRIAHDSNVNSVGRTPRRISSAVAYHSPSDPRLAGRRGIEPRALGLEPSMLPLHHQPKEEAPRPGRVMKSRCHGRSISFRADCLRRSRRSR